MKKIILVKRDDGSFVPAYTEDKEICDKMKPGEYMMKYCKPRNPRAHALAFAMARCTLENMPEDRYPFWVELYRANKHRAPYFFIKALELEIGEADPYQRPDGSIGMIPRSIAFESMSEDEFAVILDTLSRQCAKYLDITEEEMRRNYIAYL